MRILKPYLLSLGCVSALLAAAVAQPLELPVDEPPVPQADGDALETQDEAPEMLEELAAEMEEQAALEEDELTTAVESEATKTGGEQPAAGERPASGTDAATQGQVVSGTVGDSALPGEARPPDATQSSESTPGESVSPAPTRVVAEGEKGLRLNFRGAPLEMVLNYLSEAAGFVIVPETDVRGKVDVWSNQPLTKDEAVEVLNQVLSKNGYAVLRNGRTLTIVSRDEAKKRDIPVKSGYEPADIPKTDEIVTQIIPVRFINAVQLTRDLQPLLPSQATLTANESGNALVITDKQVNIRRMAEIIKALDTSVSSLSAVRVFALRYADAKSLASVIREVFQAPDASRSSSSDPRSRFFSFFRGGPPDEGRGEGRGGSTASGRPGGARVVAVADERSNALVVSAPDDLMPTIEALVNSVDTNVEDVTELRVFHLEYSDPVEMADLLSNLFPDERNSDSRSPVRFGGFFGGGISPFSSRSSANLPSDQSERLQKQSRVIAVPDQRTGSLVVSAARDLMEQIARMIEQLDANPARKQKVFVYELKNADVQGAEQIVRNLFEGQNSRNTRSSSQTRSALETRETQMQNQQPSGGFGTGFGQPGSGRQNFP